MGTTGISTTEYQRPELQLMCQHKHSHSGLHFTRYPQLLTLGPYGLLSSWKQLQGSSTLITPSLGHPDHGLYEGLE